MNSFENQMPSNELPNDDEKKENAFPYKVTMPNGVVESFQSFQEMQKFVELYKEEEN